MSEPDEDFASMFESSLQAKHVGKGQTVEGTIVAIGAEVAFVNVGGKGEAQIELSELKDADGVLEVEVATAFERWSRRPRTADPCAARRGAATDKRLEGVPRRPAGRGQGRTRVKGGYEVRVGGQRAFCPFSQIDIVRTADPAQHIGRVYASASSSIRRAAGISSCPARIARRGATRERRRGPAVDRRRRGADRTRHVRARLRRICRPGRRRPGFAPCVRDGLVPVSDSSQIVAAGEEITVKVLRIDDADRRSRLD